MFGCGFLFPLSFSHFIVSVLLYERVDAHGQTALIRELHQRYPDLVDDNSYLVKVHWSLCSLEPGVNHAKERCVLAVIEEDLMEPTVVLKVDLPPYVDIGGSSTVSRFGVRSFSPNVRVRNSLTVAHLLAMKWVLSRQSLSSS